MEQQEDLFSNRTLAAMIIPLFLEQLLVMLVGLADTLTVSYAGEAAVSGVSLVNQFNTIFIYLFTALASGGAVVISQYIGKRDTEAADFYFRKLTRITFGISFAWNLLIFLATPAFLHLYALETETKQLVIWLVLIHNVFNAVAYPFSGALSNGLRAAGDVRFTMYVSIISTIVVRFVLSYLFGITLQMGVIGIALAMVSDWIVRAVIFYRRQRSGKWKKFQVI